MWMSLSQGDAKKKRASYIGDGACVRISVHGNIEKRQRGVGNRILTCSVLLSGRPSCSRRRNVKGLHLRSVTGRYPELPLDC